METCEAMRALLSARLDGELSPEDCARLEAHLSVCPSCRAYAALLEAALTPGDAPSPPPELKTHVMARVAALPLPRRRPSPAARLLRIAVPLAAAACVALCLLTLPTLRSKRAFDAAPEAMADCAQAETHDRSGATQDSSDRGSTPESDSEDAGVLFGYTDELDSGDPASDDQSDMGNGGTQVDFASLGYAAAVYVYGTLPDGYSQEDARQAEDGSLHIPISVETARALAEAGYYVEYGDDFDDAPADGAALLVWYP